MGRRGTILYFTKKVAIIKVSFLLLLSVLTHMTVIPVALISLLP